MFLRHWLALALTFVAGSADATSFRTWNREDPLENPRYSSRNGRFVLVVREWPVVRDFESVRVDSVVDFDAEGGLRFPDDGDPETEAAALYDGRTLVAVAKIAQHHSNILISDAGNRIIVLGTEPLVTIYDARGELVRSLEVTDAFTPTDIALLLYDHPRFELRLSNDAEAGEIVTISLHDIEGVRVRTSDGSLVAPPRDRLPAPRVFATSTRQPTPRERLDPSPEDACFDNVARISSARLVAHAIERPIPDFPVVARKARIRGKVWVEVVVSESGEVRCARATRLPFGAREAALAAARRWKFTPYEIAVTSEILFHFEDVTPE